MIVCLSLPVHHSMFESHACRAIELPGVRRVLTSIRIICYEERQCVHRRKIASLVVVCTRIRNTSVISYTVLTVSGTWRLDISVTWRR